MSRFPQRREYRDDHVPGHVYLIEAIDVTGIIPGKLVRRCKIGLSRNPELRLQNFIDNQPPCNFRIIKAIYVEDMATVEDALHHQFKHCNIKLEKSREWFNLNFWQYQQALWAFSRYESHRISFEDIPKRALIGGVIGIVGLGMLVGQFMTQPQVQPTVETTEQR